MRAVTFTQYLRPNGRRVRVEIEMSDPVADKAERIVAAGYQLECEHLLSGHASLTIANHDGDQAIEVVENGPGVPDAVERLILGFKL